MFSHTSNVTSSCGKRRCSRMLDKAQFDAVLSSRGILVIDGGLALQLEERGHDLNHALWSAKVVHDQPADIDAVHLDYFLSGADIAITASYQAATRGLIDSLGVDESAAIRLVEQTVHLASNARETAYARLKTDQHSKPLLIAGSVGPYGAYLSNGGEYTGDYSLSPAQFKDFHRPRIQALIDAGSDLLALETMPNIEEISALLALLCKEFPHAIAWISCTTRDAHHLADGTPWEHVFALINAHPAQIVAFGVNCLPLASVTDTLKVLRKHTTLPLLCYPNSGETYEPSTKTWHDEVADHDSAKQVINDWTSNGAKLVGGCCRLGPAWIVSVSRALHDNTTAASLS